MRWYLTDRFYEVTDAYYQTLFCRRAHARVCCGVASWLFYTPLGKLPVAWADNHFKGYTPPIVRDCIYIMFRDMVKVPEPTYMKVKREAKEQQKLEEARANLKQQ